MTKRVVLVGIGDDLKSELLIASMREKYGDDIVLITPEQAKEQGLLIADNPPFPIIAPPVIKEMPVFLKESRRERRARERRNIKLTER